MIACDYWPIFWPVYTFVIVSCIFMTGVTYACCLLHQITNSKNL